MAISNGRSRQTRRRRFHRLTNPEAVWSASVHIGRNPIFGTVRDFANSARYRHKKTVRCIELLAHQLHSFVRFRKKVTSQTGWIS